MRLRVPSPLTPLPPGEGKTTKSKLRTLLILFTCAFFVALTSTSIAAPTVQFSTFFGGNSTEHITDVAIDQAGYIYVTGQTTSDNFPLVRAIQITREAQNDIFIAKFCPTGDTLEFSTYFGGNGNDQAASIALDSAGRIWICGGTTSTDLQMVMPLQTQNSGDEDALIFCLSNDGDSLLFSSYFGGVDNDRAVDLAIDRRGSICLVGSTNSINFPTTNALIDTLAGTDTDAFLCKIEAPSLTIQFATYFGGSGADYGVGVVVDTDGAIYICGTTNSRDLPLVNALLDSLVGGYDLYVAKVDSLGSTLIGSTYWGGAQDDFPRNITLAPNGRIIIVGKTYSTDFPPHLPLQDSCHSCPSLSDGFVTAFNGSSGAVQFSTFFGGALGEDETAAVAADTHGRLIVVGWTLASDFPMTLPLQSEISEQRDAIISIISSDYDHREFSTFYGGVGHDEARTVAITDNKIIMAGKTGSFDFPLLNPWMQHLAGGAFDGFLTRLDYDTDPSLCGDYDGSGIVYVADIVYLVQYIFAGGSPLRDGHGGDVDCDGAPTISDAVYLISYIFTGGTPPCALCQ